MNPMILWCLALSPLLFTEEGATNEAVNSLKLEHYLEWEWVDSPRLSPDGLQIIYTRGWVDKVNDRRQNDLWIMDAEGLHPRFLTEGSSARWSPDGTRIAFLKEGKPRGQQIHVMYVASREVTQISRLDESPSGLRWSPFGDQLAFSMVVPEENDFRITLPKRPKGAQWAEEAKVITRLNYRRDRRGYRPAGYRHLFVLDATGGSPRQVTEGDYDHGGPEWLPDGQRLVFSGLREEDADWQVRESEIYSVDVSSGEVRQLTKRPGPDHSPVVSPNGKYIAYLGYDDNDDTYNVQQVYVMTANGSQPRSLSAGFDRQPRGLMWSKDSSAVLFTASSHGSINLAYADLEGNLEWLTQGDQAFYANDVSREGLVVGLLATPKRPADVVRLRPVPGFSPDFVRLTSVHEDLLQHVDLGSVEEIVYPSVDDYRIQGWLVKPPNFDPQKKYPLILQIHGGPHGMYRVDFDFERQSHAAEGYVVLYTNPRGSAGYGKVFGNAINNAYPGKDYDDLMHGVDAVLDKGYIDPDQLFVYGGSGGGVLTCWIVGHTDRFRAAVSMFPVTNWISFVGTTDGPYWYHNFKKLPWEGIQEHWDRSPLKHVGKVTTPCLLMTGELDLRTPISQTEEFYQALKYRKVETAMVRIPDEYHGAAGRHMSNRLRRILYVRGWFERECSDAESEEMAGSP